MSGVYFCMGQCIACGALISFNPHKVPSLTVEGRRQPICKVCHEKWNKIHRVDQGLEPIPVLEGAYEPVDESEF